MVKICTNEILDKYDRGHELKENANAGGDTLTMRDSFIISEFHKAHAMRKAVAANEHMDGRLHIHDLGSGLSKPYCSGFDLMDLLHKGLGIPGNVRSKPAKHLDTVISQLVELFQICSNEFAGAQAVSSFDTLCAPFVYYDELRYDEVRQNMQQLVYHLNYPSRQAFQTPFTNISLDWKVSGEIAEEPAIIGGEPYGDHVYGDFQDEINMIDEAFLDVLKEGYNNKTFTFPIPTYSVQDESIFQYFDRPVTRAQRKQNLLWEVTAARGSPYFMNYLGSGLSADTRKSMCCRLSLDTSKVKEKVRGGLWNIGVKTGSMAIVTANLNRCALRAGEGGMDAYFDELGEILSVMTKQLLQRKEHVFSAYRRGQLPYAKEYLGDGSDDPNDAFGGFFLTHGIVGAYDGYMNLLGDNYFYNAFVQETLEYITGYQEDLDGEEIEYMPGKFSSWDMWNVEQTPAEGCAWKLANLDREKYPDCFVSGGEGEDVYLTNSTHLPVDVGNIIEHLELRGDTDIMYNGGTLFNWYSNEATDPVTAMETVRMLCEKTKMPYIAFSPTHGACESCGNLQTGTEPVCNKCGEPIKLMTRVVGYVRETDRFNPGQLKQYKNRSYFTM